MVGIIALMNKGLRLDCGYESLIYCVGIIALMNKGLRPANVYNDDGSGVGIIALMNKGLRLETRLTDVDVAVSESLP